MTSTNYLALSSITRFEDVFYLFLIIRFFLIRKPINEFFINSNVWYTKEIETIYIIVITSLIIPLVNLTSYIISFQLYK